MNNDIYIDLEDEFRGSKEQIINRLSSYDGLFKVLNNSQFKMVFKEL